MTIDNIIPHQRRNHTPRNLLLTARLSVHVFVPEHVYQELRPGREDVPSSGEPDLHGAVFFERCAEPPVVDGVLAHVAPQTEEGDVDGYGGDVSGHGGWDAGVPV